MKTDVLQTIKKTLEDSQGITVLSIYEENNTVFGIYINDVKDSLSFLNMPPTHISTTVLDIQIHFFELGAVLNHIYYKGALKFVDILMTSDENIKADDDLKILSDFVAENLPLNIAKVEFINAFRNNYDYNNTDDISELIYLRDVMLDFQLFIELYSDYDLEKNFTYPSGDIKTESDFVKVYNRLNSFKAELQDMTFKKVSEKNLTRLNNMYVNIQLMHMKI